MVWCSSIVRRDVKTAQHVSCDLYLISATCSGKCKQLGVRLCALEAALSVRVLATAVLSLDKAFTSSDERAVQRHAPKAH